MRRIALLIMLAAAGGLAGLPANAASNPKATGHGTTSSVDTETGEVYKRQFSFSGILQKDGTVDGQAQLHAPAYDFIAHFDVQCIRFDGPNIATLGSVVTRS